MPSYVFRLPSVLAGYPVTVTAAGSSTAIESGTLDASAKYVSGELVEGSYVATASNGRHSYTAGGESDRSNVTSLNAGGLMGTPVQGLYSRTRPTPDASSTMIRPVAADPNVAGRVWAIGSAFAQIGYTDDHGATFVAKTIPDSSAYSVQSLLFANGYAWATVSQSVDLKARLWRSPYPNASGGGWAWTKMFDFEAPPGGLTVGDHTILRNSCLAVSGANVYMVEYSTTTITGGPSLYYSADSGATWSKPKTWANAKHCHAVKVIGGVPWVTLGDGGFTDVGLWTATTAAAAAWNRRSLYGPDIGGNYLYGINFFPVTVGGVPMVAAEYDGNENYGPMLYATQDPTINRTMQPQFRLPQVNRGTMRQLTLTSEGNLMWIHTSESGALGANESIWISKPPYTSAVRLEQFASTGDTLGDGIEDGDYVWFGKSRCRKDKFIGQ